uniref:Uncharacterized protein n=1 Tax=Rhizophora mucronata TaxID=61149 RepID=A0A2P2QWE5_RHIMU
MHFVTSQAHSLCLYLPGDSHGTPLSSQQYCTYQLHEEVAVIQKLFMLNSSINVTQKSLASLK